VLRFPETRVAQAELHNTGSCVFTIGLVQNRTVGHTMHSKGARSSVNVECDVARA
jgi:hypothetical protein